MGQFVTDRWALERTFKAWGKARTKDARNISDALEKFAHMVLQRSQRYVPVDTGRLKNSGRVAGNGKQGFAAEWAVVYEAPYALVVHERVDIPHTPPTQAKYVWKALQELRGTGTALVQRQIKAGGN